MASKTEEEIRAAVEGVLRLYNIQLDEPVSDSEEEKAKRSGDYSEIISKTQARLDELNEKAEVIFKRTGMTRDQLEAYASNPNNFSKEQWEALQKVKEACDKYKREAINMIGADELAGKEQRQQQKKQPQRFAKKKHWIPL